jgi:Abnormal spindle-like microcephaly-assoc'd, ASPM-SPD-2-Hydin
MRGVLTHERIPLCDCLNHTARTSSAFLFRFFASLIVLCAILVASGCIGVTGKQIVGGSSGTPAPEISVTPTSVSFGTVNVGATATQSMVVANNGTADLTFSQISTVGTGFSLANLTSSTVVSAGQSATFTATFKPASAGNATGTISIASNASSSPVTVSLSGVGEVTNQGTPYISVSPSSANFGSVIVGNTDSQLLTISNTGTANLTVSSITASGPGFSYSGNSGAFTLTPGQGGTLMAAFAPASAGSQSGSITIVNNATSSPLVVSLSGTGVAATYQLSSSSASMSFGNVNVGSSATQNISVTNTGNSNVNISSITASGAGFSETGGSNETLTPNQSTNISVTFKPSAAGNASGNIIVTSNAQNSPLTIPLSGSGVQSAPPSVALAWQPSTSQVIGYFVYRKLPTDKTYTKLNSTVDPSTSYTDTNVATSTTYDYAVTSVDSSNVESAFSNQVTVNIP